MKIEVDTKNDSAEEILHAIKLLKAAIGESTIEKESEKETFSNEPEDDTIESEQNAGFMNFFSDNSLQNKETFSNETESEENKTEESTDDIINSISTNNNNESKIETYDSFYKEFDDENKDSEDKEIITNLEEEPEEIDKINDSEVNESEKKSKKKLFNIEFY